MSSLMDGEPRMGWVRLVLLSVLIGIMQAVPALAQAAEPYPDVLLAEHRGRYDTLPCRIQTHNSKQVCYAYQTATGSDTSRCVSAVTVRALRREGRWYVAQMPHNGEVEFRIEGQRAVAGGYAKDQIPNLEVSPGDARLAGLVLGAAVGVGSRRYPFGPAMDQAFNDRIRRTPTGPVYSLRVLYQIDNLLLGLHAEGFSTQADMAVTDAAGTERKGSFRSSARFLSIEALTVLGLHQAGRLRRGHFYTGGRLGVATFRKRLEVLSRLPAAGTASTDIETYEGLGVVLTSLVGYKYTLQGRWCLMAEAALPVGLAFVKNTATGEADPESLIRAQATIGIAWGIR